VSYFYKTGAEPKQHEAPPAQTSLEPESKSWVLPHLPGPARRGHHGAVTESDKLSLLSGLIFADSDFGIVKTG
jgi:hypothetical protein